MLNYRRGFERINNCQYLFLRSLREYGINQLELIVEEAIVNEGMRGKLTLSQSYLPNELSFLLDGAAPIESVDGCQSFRLYWKRYAAYLVTEECVGSCGKYEDESFQGDKLRLYSSSHFLEHLSRDTGGHTAPLMHYKIICQNHLVDVAAEQGPEVKMIEKADWDWIR